MLRTLYRNCEAWKLHNIYLWGDFLVYSELRRLDVSFAKLSKTPFPNRAILFPNFQVFIAFTFSDFPFSLILLESKNKFITRNLEWVLSIPRRSCCLHLVFSTLVRLLFVFPSLWNGVPVLWIGDLRFVVTHFQIEVLIIIL